MSTAHTPDYDQNDSNAPAHGQSLPRREERPVVDREVVLTRQKEEFGGIKFGSAFFGWLTATGTAVLLTALLTAAGAALGIAKGTDIGKAAQNATSNATTVGLVGAIALVVLLFVAYFAGGYVAGRMARFSGAKQGLGVWLWAVIAAVVVAAVSLLAGSKYNILSSLNSFPRIPIKEGTLTTGGIITAIAVAVISLVAAILGGLTGMRYHRKIDRTDLNH